MTSDEAEDGSMTFMDAVCAATIAVLSDDQPWTCRRAVTDSCAGRTLAVRAAENSVVDAMFDLHRATVEAATAAVLAAARPGP
jgi:hypothetical protein